MQCARLAVTLKSLRQSLGAWGLNLIHTVVSQSICVNLI